MKSLGSFLKYSRKQKGLTQDQVAERLHIVTPVLSKWENDKGMPSLAMLCKLCNVLEISLEDCVAAEKTEFSDLPPEEFDAVKLGNTLKELRNKNCWSQSEVGKKLFVTSQTVSKWESGGVTSLDTLTQLAEAFNVSPTELLSGVGRQRRTGEKFKKKHKAILKYCAVLLAAVLVILLCGWSIASAVHSSKPNEQITTPPEQSGGDGEVPVGQQPPVAVSYFVPVYGEVYRTHNQFYYNVTMNNYCAHEGVDITAENGAEVYAVTDGTISIAYGDVLDSTVIELTAANGLKIIYMGAEPIQTLTDGQTVKAGECIAKISRPHPFEYKEGEHLHLEMYNGEEKLDPLLYLPEMEISE